ncbi:tyrosine-type recombinase/integrase [Streptomyces sp. CBMA152]|uniref:tyrosine-type recombinase/integrase n=1 Tax=Streptomyces sp. CBMA152 TaxID=1896312 RepID=UPI0016608681|nr:tyrosine-type recombinase/integrase [Streptomyces sp. CBMA152]MBD0743622.1 recombinase [Streptomyces sp. CBMA152]
MGTLVQLPTGKALTVRTAADAFLDSLGNPNTVRNYGIGVGKTAEQLGEGRPLASVTDDEIGEALELLWGTSAVNTWNARRASVLSWLGWCAEYGYDGPAVPAWVKRLAVPDSETPTRSKMAIDRLIARRDVHVREKTLWRMLYETCARSDEILGVNIEELDFAGRRCPVKAKGARSKVRRRGQSREDFVLETVYWDAGTARLLPRLLRGRTRGPVFVTHRRPGPGKVLSPRDICPDTGLVRLSYGQARALLDEATATAGPGTGWDLHEYRGSGLTHLGEQGASLLMLMAKSRHKKPESVRRYFKPSAESIAELTSLLAPGDAQR